MRIHVGRAVALYIAWIGVTCGALILGLGGFLPFKLGAIAPEDAFVCFIQAELFFVLVVWPYFIPHLVTKEEKPAATGESNLLLMQVGVMLLVGLPLALVSRNLSDAGMMRLFIGQVLVVALASFVAALFSMLGPARAKAGYFTGFFILAAVPPFLHLLLVERAGGVGAPFLAAVSPFWAATQLGSMAGPTWAPTAQAAISGIAAVSLLAAAPFWKPATK